MGEPHIYHILAFCFAGQNTAGEVADEVRRGQKMGGYKVVTEAVVEVDEKGKTDIHELGRGGLGAAFGAISGGVLSLIGGPVGLLAWAVAGGVIGGVAGKHLGKAIPKKDLQALGEQMQPDTSAYMVMVKYKDVERVLDSMKAYNASVITLTVGDELSSEIASVARAQVDVVKPVEDGAEDAEQ